MAAILLDVDGVLHVSGAPIAGATDAVRRMRGDGHRVRFVTNSTTKSRTHLAEQMRAMGFEFEDEELQTTGSVAAAALRGKRVLALTMPGILDDLDGLQLIGMNADAVLIGGADEGEETGRIFSYLNLNRAFLELEAGAELYCLHKNRWWQTGRGSMQARSSRASSTRPASSRPCSASRARRTSAPRSRRSTARPS